MKSVCPQAGCKWQLASCNHPSMNGLQLSQASEQCDEVLHSNCTEIKFQNGFCSVTPHSRFPLLHPFLSFPTTSLQDTWRAIASQHIPGSLTQHAMAAQFAFNKQLNRNKKPLREEHSKSATERERERVRTMQFGKNAVTLIYLTITTKRKFYNYCACKHALLLPLPRGWSTRKCEWESERERGVRSASKGNAQRNVKVKWQLQQKPHRDAAQRQREKERGTQSRTETPLAPSFAWNNYFSSVHNPLWQPLANPLPSIAHSLC